MAEQCLGLDRDQAAYLLPVGRCLPGCAIFGQSWPGEQQPLPWTADRLVKELRLGALQRSLQGQAEFVAQPLPVGVAQECVFAQGGREFALSQAQHSHSPEDHPSGLDHVGDNDLLPA